MIDKIIRGWVYFLMVGVGIHFFFTLNILFVKAILLTLLALVITCAIGIIGYSLHLIFVKLS